MIELATVVSIVKDGGLVKVENVLIPFDHSDMLSSAYFFLPSQKVWCVIEETFIDSRVEYRAKSLSNSYHATQEDYMLKLFEAAQVQELANQLDQSISIS